MAIYFIRAGEDGPIKIGKANNPTRRIFNLQIGHPEKLHLLAVIDGSDSAESDLHAKFSSSWLRGEWFNPSPEILSLIEANKYQPVIKGLKPRIEGETLDVPQEILRFECDAKLKGYGVIEICKRLKIHRATWQRWKKGDHEPTIGTWEAIKHVVATLPSKPTKAPVEREKGD